MNIRTILERLRKVKKHGTEDNKWTALCPAPQHKDKKRSFSIKLAENGTVLIKCHAGCTKEDILDALDLKWQDLFPEKIGNKKRLTLKELAFDKGLSCDFLSSLGLRENNDKVEIPYFLEDGSLSTRYRIRRHLTAKRGTFWNKPPGKIVPYGLWKLQEAQKLKWITFVEGESDCWSMWKHGLPALGFPGASMTKKLEVSHIKAMQKIYVVQEPDKAGSSFTRGIRKQLYELGYQGLLFVIQMVKFKDINELELNSSNFANDFAQLQENAWPLSLVENEITVDYGDLIPDLPEPQNETVTNIMEKAVKTKDNFSIIAPQGAGKSYANSRIAVQEFKKGRSVFIFSRSHDELNQLGKAIATLLPEKQKHQLFHLKRGYDSSSQTSAAIPDIQPVIVIAPHAYLKFKGDTPYHYAIVDMIFQEKFGKNPLVLIDEVGSFLESSFISKPLGSRESERKIFGEKLLIRNNLCPLHTASGNCNNCVGKMFLVLRSHSGMLQYKPLSQRYKGDKVKQESVELKYIRWDAVYDDNTMRVYPLDPPCQERNWSVGGKDTPLEQLSLQKWYDDIVTRCIDPNIVFFYPYNATTQKNIGRPLAGEEINSGRYIPPRSVCGVPILQGWDLAVSKEMTKHVQIGVTGPGASEIDRYILKQTLNLNKKNFHIAEKPYFQFKKVLIIALTQDLPNRKLQLIDFFEGLIAQTKILAFYSTYADAKTAERKVSENIRTMYYDGEQKITNTPIEDTSITFDMCISCIHGPLGQGINLGQFKMVVVSTNNERPKCLFAGRPQVKTIRKFIIDDVAEKARQAALRILRLDKGEESEQPRVVLFHGRNAIEVSRRVVSELSKVGHQTRFIDAEKSVLYAKDMSCKWLQGLSVVEFENMGGEQYEKEKIVAKIKDEILPLLQKDPASYKWSDAVRHFRELRNLTKMSKNELKEWIKGQTIKAKNKIKLLKTVEKIRQYIKENPKVNWTKVYRKFNLSRKTTNELQFIQEKLSL